MYTADQRATLGLWSIQGIGPVTLEKIRNTFKPIGALLKEPVAEWAPAIEFHGEALERLLAVGTLAAAAERVEEACNARRVRILFSEDPAFPWRLRDIPDA